ncbi:hypothetical protein [Bacillus solimangrovi]|uniref:Uncharacterized protein n=1 Tax=Bacillus solimangrovi TaxID=1305675 RepID=A0A1E5LCZ9_9BACI|nr:hypothetical protein [Bacillus solimangrovi]OEH91955.1 hypothetical protein BFG57_17495 [Bacillus solimangrovi]
MLRTIRTRRDIEKFLNEFDRIAQYDVDNQKWYFVFVDYNRSGFWTLMKKDEQWSLHGKGDTYSDIQERLIDREEVYRHLWKCRKAVNEELKRKVLV